MNTTDPTRPDWVRPEAVDAAKDLKLMHDLLGGTRRMHDESKDYIRKWKHEDLDVYNMRRKIEELFEGTGRTLSAAVGMIYAQPPTITWNGGEAIIKEHWANIDAAGTAGHVFSKRFTDTSIRDGIGLLLVDHPPAPIDPETKKPVMITSGNERAFNLRPRWASYGRGQAINWRTSVVNNETVLTMLVFHEFGEVEDNTYGVKVVHRYRVLQLTDTGAAFSLYEKVTEGGRDTFPVVASGFFRNIRGEVATFLPVSVAYTGRTEAAMTASLPLVGVANANLGHWRQATNLRFYRELCAFPQPKLKGKLMQKDGAQSTPGHMRIGPLVLVHVDADSDFEWVELAGSSMEQLEKGVNEKLQAMAQQGMSFLFPDTRAAETAEAKRLDSTAENSTLATAGQGVEDAINLSLEHHAWYMGIDKKQAPMLSLSRDYDSTAMEPQAMRAYSELVKVGFPKRVVLEALQAGGRIPADANLDRLEMHWIVGEIAAERSRELEDELDLEGAA